MLIQGLVVQLSGSAGTPGFRYPHTTNKNNQKFTFNVLLGYLLLLQEYPTLTTFFEGEIISKKHPFLTRKWDADEDVDRKHWVSKAVLCPGQQKTSREWQAQTWGPAGVNQNPSHSYPRSANPSHKYQVMRTVLQVCVLLCVTVRTWAVSLFCYLLSTVPFQSLFDETL